MLTEQQLQMQIRDLLNHKKALEQTCLEHLNSLINARTHIATLEGVLQENQALVAQLQGELVELKKTE